MKVAFVLVAALMAAATTAVGSVSAAGPAQLYIATCSDAVYETPATQPPETFAALRLGPVVFNHLAPGAPKDVSPPLVRGGFYNLASFFNVMPSATHGVTIRLIGGDASNRLATGKIGASPPARAIRFPICRDAATKTLQITQYGLSFLLRKPTCVTVEVQPVGSTRRYRATVPVRASHC